MLDVDGVLTDGAIVYSEAGTLIKAFSVQDGHAMKLWRQCGRRAAILSGRETPVVSRRAAELGVEEVIQGQAEKDEVYAQLLERTGVAPDEVCFMGDDRVDIGPMQRCGFPVATANAVSGVKQVAQYVTRRSGGAGAVAEVIELLLRKQGLWPPERHR